jgi:hypothetical protein
LRAGLRLEQCLEPRGVGFGDGNLSICGAGVGLSGRELGVGLADILDAGAGSQEAELSVGLIALGAGARERQLGVGGIEPRHELAGRDAVALVRREFQQPPANQRRYLHLGGFNLSRNADTIGRRGSPAGTTHRDQKTYAHATQGD